MDLRTFRAFSGSLTHPMLLCTAGGRILAANRAAVRAADSLRVDGELLEIAQDPADLRARLDQWLRSGSALPGTMTVKAGDGSTVRFRCHGARASWWTGPEPVVQLTLAAADHSDRFVALSEQVRLLDRQMAYRRAMEAQQEELLRTEKAARERMQRLYRLTASLAASATLSEVCAAVHEAAPQVLGATGVTLELHSDRIVPSLDNADALPSAGQAWTDLDASDDGHPPRPEEAFTGSVSVPLTAEGVVLGYLRIDSPPGTAGDPQHTTAIAQQIAQAVRRAGLFEHEHRLAERLQRSLLPKLPVIDDMDIASAYAPGTHMVDVGGDWYDVHVLDEDTVGLTIGDVAGHGVAEATAMAQICAALRSIVRRSGHRPDAVLEELNDFLSTYLHGRMATACYATYNRRTRILRYARAGHPPPLLLHRDGASRYLDKALAPPLGPVRNVPYRQEEVPVSPGDALVLYTDGLIERRGERLDVGLQRMTRLGRRAVGMTAQEMCGLYLEQQADVELPDDRALLIARLNTAA